MAPRYFMSYSRQELYYAEALVIALQRAGLDVWFDLQQLEPGSHWEKEIERGLEDCTAVIVLASPDSLTSTWVTREWEHALNNGKPIHIVVFQATDFIPVRLKTGQIAPLDKLIENAASIIDGRRNFSHAVRRIIAILKENQTVRDPVPVPNRFRLSHQVPMAINGVSLSLIAVMLALIWMSIHALDISPPLTIAGLLSAGWVGNRLLAFMRRESYRDARAILFCASLIVPVISPLLAPIVWIGTVLAFLSPDIHRYSPLGQGLESRQRRARLKYFTTRRATPRGFINNLTVLYGRLPSVAKILLIFFGAMATLFFLLVITVPSRNRSAEPDLILIIASFLLGPTVVIGTFILRGRYKRLIDAGLGRAESTGLKYRVVHADADAELARQISNAMDKAGHENIANKFKWVANDETRPDYTFILLTNNITINEVQPLAGQPERLVFLVASPLQREEDFREFAQYQWVDIRRQTPDLLTAFAEDLMIFGSGIVPHSFGTRQTPQSFNKMLIPPRVLGYILFQFIGLYLTLAVVLFQLTLVGGSLPILQFVLMLPSILLTTWLSNRVMQREITVNTIIKFNLTISVISYIIGLIYGLSQPLPPGYVRDTGLIAASVASWVIGLAIGYFIGRGVLRSVFGGWLPSYIPFAVPFPGFRRDRALWMRNLFTCAVLGLVILLLTANQVTMAADSPNSVGSGQQVRVHPALTLTIPNHWKRYEQWDRTIVRVVPVRAILARLNTPISMWFAALFPRNVSETLPEPDADLYSRLRAWNGSTAPLYRAVYMPQPMERAGVGFSVWEIPEMIKVSDQSYDELLSIMAGAAAEIVQRQLSGATLWETQEISPNGDLNTFWGIYDTPSADFLLVLNGDPRFMREQSTWMQSLVEQAQVIAMQPSATPTSTLTPTPSPSPTAAPTLPPTATPSPFPTFAPFTPISLAALPTLEQTSWVLLDGLGFRAPTNWQRSIEVDAQSIQWDYNYDYSINNLLLTSIFTNYGELKWAAASLTYSTSCVIGVYEFNAGAEVSSASEYLDVIMPQFSYYSTLIEDRKLTGDSPIAVRRLVVDTESPGYTPLREWMISVDSEEQDYLIWVVGSADAVTDSFSSVLDEWLGTLFLPGT